jgi:hypothetical protein
MVNTCMIDGERTSFPENQPLSHSAQSRPGTNVINS